MWLLVSSTRACGVNLFSPPSDDFAQPQVVGSAGLAFRNACCPRHFAKLPWIRSAKLKMGRKKIDKDEKRMILLYLIVKNKKIQTTMDIDDCILL